MPPLKELSIFVLASSSCFFFALDVQHFWWCSSALNFINSAIGVILELSFTGLEITKPVTECLLHIGRAK